MASSTAEPWLTSECHGLLLKKSESRNMFESAWKEKLMCWVSHGVMYMRQAEVVVFRANQGSKAQEKIAVADDGQILSLVDWVLSENAKDLKGEKFTLRRKDDANIFFSFKASTTQEAGAWVSFLKTKIQTLQDKAEAARAARGNVNDKENESASQAHGSQPNAHKGPTSRNQLHGINISYMYDNGDHYVGDFHFGKKHGTGRYTRKDGSVYEGEYQNDQKHGNGKLIYKSGDTFVGTWKEGVQCGFGVLKCADGRVYEGEWKDGKQHGKGTFKSADGGGVYQGEWMNGVKHGRGKSSSSDGHVYDGEWRNNKKEGRGKHVRPDGSSYDGEWKNDKKHGKGTYKYTNGDYYEGETKNGLKHGYGIFKASNGARYEGEWVEGKKHGQGTYTSNQGKVYKGKWKDDRPCDAPDTASGSNDKQEKEKAEGNKNYFGFFQARGNAPQQAKQQAHGPEDEQARAKREQEEAAEKRAAERARQRMEEEEAMRAANLSGPVMKDLEPQLDKIKAASKKSAQALLQHVFKYHPPRNNPNEIPSDFSDAMMRKTLLKTIRIYHQDKNSIELYGLEWHLLCREITKQLNSKFELYKQ
uniref:PH domain-containing protein n=1 Tax=Guillardia theta TaxID=55529 RepID=A0A7S4PNC4_GUITH|mmetsp:Transcript_7504/g.25596  ORF Transcript_7504/g.25596 Transcript_7504/m.25596 type:complete len:587 (+) Transcript_7504:175-1935(+)